MNWAGIWIFKISPSNQTFGAVKKEKGGGAQRLLV